MGESIIIPGFPEEVSPKIEMPDIAEMLTYPMFMVAEADTVWKYGTEFHRRLLSMTPTRNNRKTVTVLSTLHLVYPGMRAMTTKTSKVKEEWHIDGREDIEDARDHIFPEETCHLLIGYTDYVTMFNENPLAFDRKLAMSMDRRNFSNYIIMNFDKLDLKSKAIERDRIYTFTNHIHRAVEPESIQFRYTWRVRETDRDDIPPVEQQIIKENKFLDVQTREWKPNIRVGSNIISIEYPEWR